MKSWETALDQFLVNWRQRKEVIGIVVCGSYITGNPSKRSDIDVHIIIQDECDWRERGNQVVNGFLIEYFVNPPKQIRSYYVEDFKDRRTMSMVQFMTGKVIQDKVGAVKELIEEAHVWKEKQYEPVKAPIAELKKYELWDTLDNLLDCYEEGRSDFNVVFYHSLQRLYCVYSSLLCIEEIPYYQLSRYFTDPNYLKKYMKEPFPDMYFSQRFINAMTAENQDEKIRIFTELTEHVLHTFGGFDIDGWRIRSELSLL